MPMFAARSPLSVYPVPKIPCLRGYSRRSCQGQPSGLAQHAVVLLDHSTDWMRRSPAQDGITTSAWAGKRKSGREMGSIHLPRLAVLPVGTFSGSKSRTRQGRAALAVTVLAALALVSGVQRAAYGAVEAPFGGTAAAVPGTVQAANYDTGGQGTAYNVTSVNGSANSYRSDGVDLETTADTVGTSPAGGTYDMGWTTPGQQRKDTVNARHAPTPTASPPSGAGPRCTGSPTRCTSPRLRRHQP